jgi:hypothetical protein
VRAGLDLFQGLSLDESRISFRDRLTDAFPRCIDTFPDNQHRPPPLC